MKENETLDNSEEFGRLAGILRATDLSGKSKVRASLKERLLAAKQEEKSFPPWKWLIPAGAAAMAALVTAIGLGGHRAAGQQVSYQAPDAGYNVYAECGRQGLEDNMSAPRF